MENEKNKKRIWKRGANEETSRLERDEKEKIDGKPIDKPNADHENIRGRWKDK